MESVSGLQENPRRSRMEIMCDILSAVSAGSAKPTHIASRANLSWTILSGFLSYMVNLRLLEKSDLGRRTLYKIAPKGLEVLHRFSELKVDLGANQDESENRMVASSYEGSFLAAPVVTSRSHLAEQQGRRVSLPQRAQAHSLADSRASG